MDLVPTIYDLCDYNVTAPLQGKSMIPLLDGKTTKHREHVIVEYAQNDEVMIRDDDWKLIYERNARRRTDGYDTERPLKPNQFRLYDLHSDPRRCTTWWPIRHNAETVATMLTACWSTT